jgi:hypothetical protein
MTQGIETRRDGKTLVVRIPMRFQRRGGRKRIVATNGSELAPTSKPRPDGTLVKALARAWRWQRMLDEGRCASVRELSEVERVSLSYISRMLRLTPARTRHRGTDLGRVLGTPIGGADAAVSGLVGAAAGPFLLAQFEADRRL